jgi:Ala-tRNA(Pro) deacylase
MAIAKTLINYLEEKGVDYDLVEHAHTSTSFASARASDLPPHQVAKAVVLKDDGGYVVSVLPTNHSLEIEWVNEELNRNLEMACEDEFKSLFKDCEAGAVPALGEAYGMQVIWDDDLAYTADVYIEAGDHEHLIWLDRKAFKKLMSSLPHTVISRDEEVGCWKY